MTADARATPTTGWYMIDLDRSPDRLARIRAGLGALGIAAERVPAVDGKTLALPHPGIDPVLYRRTHGRDLALGEAGCHLSHLRALEAFLHRGTATGWCWKTMPSWTGGRATSWRR